LAGVYEGGGAFDAGLRTGVDLAESVLAVRAGVRVVEGVDLDAVGVFGAELGDLGATSSGSAGGAGTGSGVGSGVGTFSSTFSSSFFSSGSTSAGGSRGVTSDPTLNTDIRFQLVGGLALPAALAFDLGGHSRLSFTSMRDASAAALRLDAALSERGPGGLVATLWVCCSNRPIRFCTLARGRSSGSGLSSP
jgi:hypothetical protein